MSESNWRLVVFLGAISALSLVAFWAGTIVEPKCIADSGEWKAYHEAEQVDRETEYSGQVTCNSDCQIHFGFPERVLPTSDIDGHSESRERPASNPSLPPVEERDLCAQTRVAWWTRIIALFTAVSAGLLFWTLLETRRDITKTREIGEAQTRAQVGINKVAITFGEERKASIRPSVPSEPGGPSPVIMIEVENFGPSEAKNFSWDFEIMYSAYFISDGLPRGGERKSAPLPPPFSKRVGDSIYPRKIETYLMLHGFNVNLMENAAMNSPGERAFLLVSVLIRFAYEDVFGNWHGDLRQYCLQMNPTRLAEFVPMRFFPLKELLTQEELKNKGTQ